MMFDDVESEEMKTEGQKKFLAGNMDSRGRMFKYNERFSDSEDDSEYGSSETNDDEHLGSAEAQASEDPPPADIHEVRLSSMHSAPASSTNDTKADADSKTVDVWIKTPEELIDFASWAFGTNGIPSLQVLAYGDFSFDGRFRRQTFCSADSLGRFQHRKTLTLLEKKSNR